MEKDVCQAGATRELQDIYLGVNGSNSMLLVIQQVESQIAISFYCEQLLFWSSSFDRLSGINAEEALILCRPYKTQTKTTCGWVDIVPCLRSCDNIFRGHVRWLSVFFFSSFQFLFPNPNDIIIPRLHIGILLNQHNLLFCQKKLNWYLTHLSCMACSKN